MKKAQYAYFLIPYIVPYLVGNVQKEPPIKDLIYRGFLYVTPKY